MNIWLMNHYATQMMEDKAGRHYWFAEHLRKKGHKVTVFCASTFLNKKENIDTGKALFKVNIVDNIPFVVIKTPSWQGNGLSRIRNMTWFAWNLFRICENYAGTNGKPDVILASSVHPLTMVAGIRVAKKLDVPCICEIRDLWPEAIFAFGFVREKSLIGQMLIRGEHWIYRNADALVFTKEGDVDYLKERGWDTEQGGDISLNKCHYINNGIDIVAFDKRIESECLEDDDLKNTDLFKVVYAGTIRPVNNVDMIVECAKILQVKGYKKIRFLIYGDGSERHRLQELVEKQAITNVSFKGHVERKYIPYVLSRSDINLLNYTQSGYNWSRGNSSNKLFEYMASGKPIISTVKMGYSIIEKYKCGIELDECSAVNLAGSIERVFLMNHDQRVVMGDNGKLGANDFDFSVLTDRLEQVFKQVIR